MDFDRIVCSQWAVIFQQAHCRNREADSVINQEPALVSGKMKRFNLLI